MLGEEGEGQNDEGGIVVEGDAGDAVGYNDDSVNQQHHSVVVAQQSFSSVQSRTLTLPAAAAAAAAGGNIDSNGKQHSHYQVASLCPSMDLVIVECHNKNSRSSSKDNDTTNAATVSSSLDIYRTMSWQKVASISTNTDSSSTNDRNDGNKDKISPLPSPLLFGWSPNGQCVAVARGNKLSLYDVEGLSNPLAAGDANIDVSNNDGIGSNSNDSSSSSSSSPSSSSSSQHSMFTMTLPKSRETTTTIRSLCWVHVGRDHPTASAPSQDELEREISWRYQSQYVDQSTNFLPPSSYYHDEYVDSNNDNFHTLSSKAVHESKTPLSVLCAATNDGFELFVHGRYHLLSLPRHTTSATVQPSIPTTVPIVTASNDLSYWLVSDGTGAITTGSNSNSNNYRGFRLYRMPFLKQHRYALQQIATLHTSIMSHIATLQKSAKVVADNWKTSLKPLDQKLQPLLRLLSNYGIDVEIEGGKPSVSLLRNVLKDYILMGHTGHSTSIANAMDQFFTGVQMNDQLLQRMERTLNQSISNVETTAIVDILRPSQALGWQVQELACLVRYFSSNCDDEDDGRDFAADPSPSLSKDLLLSNLIGGSESLWIVAEHIQTSIVNARLAIRDFCGWLRHASSQVKARGTAQNSVQRENARKRRVSQAVLERIVSSMMMGYISSDSHGGIGTSPKAGTSDGASSFSASIVSAASRHVGLAEALLGLNVTELLRDDTATAMSGSIEANSNRASSPVSVTSKDFLQPIHRLPASVNRVKNSAQAVFDNPLSNIPDQLKSEELYLPRMEKIGDHLVVAHSRIGLDPSRIFIDDCLSSSSDDEESDKSYFLPQVSDHRYPQLPSTGLNASPHWFVVAQASGSTIQLFALPVGRKNPVEDESDAYSGMEDDDDAASDRILPSFYLTARVDLSKDGNQVVSGKILQLAFYGDDGKSSLSSGHDSGTGKEGRQKLVLLYQAHDVAAPGEEPNSNIELWTFRYDQLTWHVVPFDKLLVGPSHVDKSCCHLVAPEYVACTIEEGEDDRPQQMITAQVRTITERIGLSSNSWLFTSGSRGIGGVGLLTEGNDVLLDLLDLEDCEEEEEE